MDDHYRQAGIPFRMIRLTHLRPGMRITPDIPDLLPIEFSHFIGEWAAFVKRLRTEGGKVELLAVDYHSRINGWRVTTNVYAGPMVREWLPVEWLRERQGCLFR